MISEIFKAIIRLKLRFNEFFKLEINKLLYRAHISQSMRLTDIGGIFSLSTFVEKKYRWLTGVSLNNRRRLRDKGIEKGWQNIQLDIQNIHSDICMTKKTNTKKKYKRTNVNTQMQRKNKEIKKKHWTGLCK